MKRASALKLPSGEFQVVGTAPRLENAPLRPGVTERPTHYADRLGAWYGARVSADHRKNVGLYLTPVAVADFMARQITADRNSLRILDPAAGAGILLCATVEALLGRSRPPVSLEIVAYEIDAELAGLLRQSLSYLEAWVQRQGIKATVQVICTDFILEHGEALAGIGSLLKHVDHDAFDIVIANPPYFKLPKSDPRAQAAATVVHGQPNIYGLFMAVSAALLREGGEMVFITPRSFASGPYFRRFREWFFDFIRPELVHVFGSRRDAFSRDDVLQENIILAAVRQEEWHHATATPVMVISSSKGTDDLDQAARRSVRVDATLDMWSADKVLRLPIDTADDDVVRLVDSWSGSLRKYGLNISTGPVVPFRAKELLAAEGNVPRTHVPLLWMNHVRPMLAQWPIGKRKPEYIKLEAELRSLLVPNRNYVLLRRFSAKEERRRLTAAPYLASAFRIEQVGFENHLNYVHRPGGTLDEDEALGLAALYNSALLDRYFRAISGNTQVSATELRAMPLPAREIILAIGKKARELAGDPDAIDALVAKLVGTEEPERKRARGND